MLKLGGDDFDRVILEDIVADKIGIRKLKRELAISGFDEIYDSDSGVELMRSIQRAKEDLSSYEFANISLMLDKFNINIDITREEFEAAIAPFMDQIKGCVLNCLASANNNLGISTNEIDVVVLAGGSSLIPLVQDTLSDIFGANKVKVHEDAMTCIARGLSLRGSDNISTKFNDILEHSYGIYMLDYNGSTAYVCDVLKKGIKINEIKSEDYYQEFIIDINSTNTRYFRVPIYEDGEKVGVIRVPLKNEIMRDSKFKLYFIIDKNLEKLEVQIFDMLRNQKVDVPIEQRFININKLEA